jgi:hypothetical protein
LATVKVKRRHHLKKIPAIEIWFPLFLKYSLTVKLKINLSLGLIN